VVNGGIGITRGGVTLSYDLSYEMWAGTPLSMVWKSHYYGIPKLKNILLQKVGINMKRRLGWLAVMAGYSYVPSILGRDAGTKVASGWIQSEQSGVGMYNYLITQSTTCLRFTFTVPQVWRLTGKIVITLHISSSILCRKACPKQESVIPVGAGRYGAVLIFSIPRYRYAA